MEEKLNQLYKNETWILIPKEEIKPDHRLLGDKWVYKIKWDIDGNIA